MFIEEPTFSSTQAPADAKTPKVYREIIARAGVEINGPNPWDIQVLDDRAYQYVFARGTLGFGEAYVEGYWECRDLAGLMTRFVNAHLADGLSLRATLSLIGRILQSKFMNFQSISRAFQVGEQHYDIGNDVYNAMLDKHRCYSCGYWENASNLEEAQEAKLDLICRKLQLEPGMTVLDVGCGWGSLSAYMAKHYDVKVTGITVSKEQAKLAKEHCKGLDVDIQLIDYRKLAGTYDRIVSVGMFEHVGERNYQTYFAEMHKLLASDGYFLLHTIGTGMNKVSMDAWIEKYIFPNGELPYLSGITSAAQPHFRVEDLHNFGTDYDKTLVAWWNNFYQAWPQLSEKYDERFLRMWRYYLMSCAGFFRSGNGQLWQFVLKPISNAATYRSVR